MQKLLKNRWKIPILLSFLILAFLNLAFSNSKQSLRSDELKSKLLNEKLEEQSASEELSSADYKKIRDQYINLLNSQNPRITLDQLREDIKTNDLLSRSCHILTHELGRESYKKYQDFAQSLKYQDEVCNSGFLHGVIEAHFQESADIFKKLNNVCSQYNADTFLGWECYHGIGHGVMYFTSNDLEASLNLCGQFKDEIRSVCVNGVFMENFATDQKLHPSKYLKKDDPFYPCSLQSNRDKYDCFTYAPVYFLTLNNHNYSKALKWCREAEEEYQDYCVQGVGGQMIKENINNPKLVEKMCMSAQEDQIEPCISGMVNLYINHFGSLENARELCIQFEESNKQICEEVIQLKSAMF